MRRPVVLTITNITKNGADATEDFAAVLGDYRAASIPDTFSGSLSKLAEAAVIGRMWENGSHYVMFAQVRQRYYPLFINNKPYLYK